MILTWKPHISLLASKLSKSIGIIHKSRFFLSTQSLRTLYNSMILPYLYYCNLAWGGTYKANLQRIVILQKRALRIVNNSTYDANTSLIFKELQLLKFRDIHSFQLVNSSEVARQFSISDMYKFNPSRFQLNDWNLFWSFDLAIRATFLTMVFSLSVRTKIERFPRNLKFLSLRLFISSAKFEEICSTVTCTTR